MAPRGLPPSAIAPLPSFEPLRRSAAVLAAAALGVSGAGCGAEEPALAAHGEPWEEADALFHQDPRWLGADDAYSVDLGGGRVLWLFGDTFVATSDAHVRSESRLVRNSVAIQTGTDPGAATIELFWRGTPEEPASFFPEDGDTWFWPGDGERVGDRLFLFLMSVRAASDGLGFDVSGSAAVVVDNPDDAPDTWQLTRIDLPPNEKHAVLGSASVLVHDGALLAFGSEETGSHHMDLARFPLPSEGLPDLGAPEWLGPGLEDGQTELTVHPDPARDLWIEVQSRGFGATEIALRTAPSVDGPWSAMRDFYHPPESDRSDTLVYAGKAHPELEGADLIVTYAANSTDFGTLLSDESLYYPRFVRVTYDSP